MPQIKVKQKFQVTIPSSIRKAAGLAVGDYLEALVEGDNIVLKPKAQAERDAIEAALAAGLLDYEAGNVIGPFKSMVEYREYKQSQKKK